MIPADRLAEVLPILDSAASNRPNRHELADVLALLDGLRYRRPIDHIGAYGFRHDLHRGVLLLLKPCLRIGPLALRLAIHLDGHIVVHVAAIDGLVLRLLGLEAGILLPLLDDLLILALARPLDLNDDAIGVRRDDLEALPLKAVDEHEQTKLSGDRGLDQKIRREQDRPARAELAEGAVDRDLETVCDGLPLMLFDLQLGESLLAKLRPAVALLDRLFEVFDFVAEASSFGLRLESTIDDALIDFQEGFAEVRREQSEVDDDARIVGGHVPVNEHILIVGDVRGVFLGRMQPADAHAIDALADLDLAIREGLGHEDFAAWGKLEPDVFDVVEEVEEAVVVELDELRDAVAVALPALEFWPLGIAT